MPEKQRLPLHTTAPQDMTKVQLPHHHGDFHFA
jgi:hypothetical protein